MSAVREKRDNYVDNKRFLELLIEYKKGEKDENGRRFICDELGEMFQKIATGFGQRYSYRNYPFLNDIISDGVLCCVNKIDNFDPEKYDNPFGYFTKLIWYSFLQTIDKEKRNLYNSYKLIEEFIRVTDNSTAEHDSDLYLTKEIVNDDYKVNMTNFISKYDVYKDAQSARSKKRYKEKVKAKNTEPTIFSGLMVDDEGGL